MSAIPSFVFHDVDASTLDDKMDLTSSPFRPTDDVDLELDSVRDASEAESMHDSMVDDRTEPVNLLSHDPMQSEFEVVHDDDMVDDGGPGPDGADYNMDAYPDNGNADEDEEILYEEEEDVTVMLDDHKDDDVDIATQQQQQQQQPLDMEPLETIDSTQNKPEKTQEHYDEQNNNTLASDGWEAPTREMEPSSAEADHNVQLHEEAPSATEVNEPGLDLTTDAAAIEQSGELHKDGPSPKDFHNDTDRSHADDVASRAHQDDENGAPRPEIEDSLREGATPLPHHQLPEEPVEEPRRLDDATAPAPDLSLHPVKLVYLGEEMSLFPPSQDDESSTFFLSDASLAFESLDKLLSGCREILTGSLGHDDELVFDVAALGLHICEDSKYAAQITLSQVLDVYLNLCHNDPDTEIQPLYCNLSSRVSLASQYSYLVAAAREGKTFSEIAADYLDSPFHEPEGDEEAGDSQLEERPDQEEPAVPVAGDDAANNAVSDHLADLANEVAPQTDIAWPEDAVSEPVTGDLNGTSRREDGHVGPSTGASTAGHDAAEHSEPEQSLEQPAPQSEEGLHLVSEPEYEEHGPDIVQSSTLEHDGFESVSPSHDDHDHDHEEESNSSHTLEAESATAIAEESGQDTHQGDIDDVGLLQEEQVLESGAHHDAGQTEGYESYSDEELFKSDDEGNPADQDTDDAAHTPGQRGPVNATQIPSEVSPSTVEPDASASNGTLSNVGGLERQADTSPVTPSRSKTAKRKVEDDEFDLLDTATPEPKQKRRRPS